MSYSHLNNEGDILNRLDVLKSNLYKGNLTKEDSYFAIQTINRLLLENDLLRREADDKELKRVNDKMAAKQWFNKTSGSYEANKPV